MTTTPRLIMGCAAYNESPYLDETIPAILSQSMGDFALMLFDNGSTDDTWEIMQRYAAADSRITLTRSPTNLWPPVVANQCIAAAFARCPATRWHLAHGADDMMEPEYLEMVLRTAAVNPNANCIYSPWRWIDHPEKGVKVFPAFDVDLCHATHMMPAWRAITRELWHAVGPENEAIRIGSDWEWPVRAAVAGVLRPVQLEKPYISLRVRDGERKSQSDEVDWPALHRILCRVAGKPIPGWAC